MAHSVHFDAKWALLPLGRKDGNSQAADLFRERFLILNTLLHKAINLGEGLNYVAICQWLAPSKNRVGGKMVVCPRKVVV